ncbi:MAG: acyloxyacyl hydrolase [Steroidobacteraceae bacterium]
MSSDSGSSSVATSLVVTRSVSSLSDWLRRAAVTGVLALSLTTQAVASVADIVKPTGAFVQAGFGESQTTAYVVGAVWDWRWQKQYAIGTITGFSDASIGRWATEADGIKGSAWATQIGLTPVFRLQPALFTQPWFIEIGIGANVILPIYRSDEKSFSTEFNFGDHFAVGRMLGDRHRQDIALRIQHFSNGGIKHPNPGENFLQLRYTYRH